MSNQKYQILENQYLQYAHPVSRKIIKLFRIIALKEFESKIGIVHEGQIGGWIQSEVNLSQNDSSWVWHTAKVFDSALLVDSSISEDAQIFGDSIITDSVVRDRAMIYGSCTVTNSLILDNSDVYGKNDLDDCSMKNGTRISGNNQVSKTHLSEGAMISGFCKVRNSVLKDVCEIMGQSEIENCQYAGRVVVKNAKKFNETITNHPDLQVIHGEN